MDPSDKTRWLACGIVTLLVVLAGVAVAAVSYLAHTMME